MGKYNSGTYTLIGIANTPVTADVNNNATVVFDIVGTLDSFNITSAAGSVVTINNLVNAANNFNVTTNGGTIEFGTLAGALGNVTATIDGGGQFIVGQTDIGILNNANIGYGAGGGTLVLGTDGTLAAIATSTPITGFDTMSDVIDDRSLSFAGFNGYTVSGSGNVQTITVNENGCALQFETSGANLKVGTFTSLQAGPLKITADGHGGTDLTVCFLEGTNISTPDGEKPVESLQIGDLVTTADGRAEPVKWMGRLTVCTAFADALRTMPVRIRANALGDTLPKRDLLVSPQHAMFLDGILVQAGAMVNGTTIIRETRMPRLFRYYHVELADHALILAEGAPSETFIDNVDRMAFDNWSEHLALFGDQSEMVEMTHPRAKSARQIPQALRATLARQADKLCSGALQAA